MTFLIAALFALFWSCGWILAGRLTRRGGETISQRNNAESPNDEDLSIIIPARNEAHNLPRLLDSLRAQCVQATEILVVDDGSTDNTAEIAEMHGAQVLTSAPLPSGWRGKTWACHQGASITTGQTLLFLDADTWFEPGGLRQLLAEYETETCSVSPFHRICRPYEWFSLFFNLCMASGTVPNGLSGQCLRASREDYHRAGGHAAVRGDILENFMLARRFREAGVRIHCLPGRGLLSFRMYPGGFGELIDGWTKGFAAGAGGTSRRDLAVVVAWMIGLMLPMLCVLLPGFPPELGCTGWLIGALQVARLGRLVGNFPIIAALFYPIALIFFFVLFAVSAVKSGQNVKWKGRTIHAH